MAKRLLSKPLPKDHPLFKRGFIVGIKNTSHFPRKKEEKSEHTGTEKPDKKEIKEDNA
jgi:hypothetical protein